MSVRLGVGIAALAFGWLRAAPSTETQCCGIPFRLENHLILVEGSGLDPLQRRAVNVLPFNLLPGNKIVVKGAIGGTNELDMLIDTGSDCTVVDKRVADRLQLPPLGRTVGYAAAGQSGTAWLVLVRDLRLGPIQLPISCLVADLSAHHVDVIIGLNVLRRNNFTIDYGSRRIIFEQASPLESSACFQPGLSVVIVPVKVKDQEYRFLVDSGAATLCLYENGPPIWQSRKDWDRAVITPFLGRRAQSREVPLQVIQIGSTVWKELTAMLLADPKPPDWDGVLAIGSLGLKRIHFDFERGLLSWEK